MTDLHELHRRAVAEFDARAHAIRADQWHEPTPCADWDVRDLVEHVVYEDRWAVPLLDGRTLEEVGDRFEGDLLGDAPLAAWDEASSEAVKGVQNLDAPDRAVHVSWGEIPASEYVLQLVAEHVVHGWDLARAIGADEHFEEELVRVLYEQVKLREDEMKATGLFGERIDPPQDADVQTKLLAVFGRRA